MIQRDSVSHTEPVVRDPAVAGQTSSWVIGTAFCAFTLVFFLFLTGEMWHWFVIPVFASGVLVSRDAVEWLRGRMETMDPLGLFSLFGLYFFFISYLLHVALDYFWHYRYPPSDWRPWLGLSALVNVVGLLLFRSMLRLSPKRPPNVVWVLHRGRFLAAAGIALVGSALLQSSFYSQLGGIVEAAFVRENRSGGGDPFEGLGWAITLAESFPVVLVITLLVLTRKARFWKSSMAIPILLTGTLMVALIFGFFRGSRSTIFVVVFWAAVLFHIYVRPIDRKLVMAGPVLLFLFMTGAMYYKHGGVEGAARFGDTEVIHEIEDRIGFGNAYAFILLHDLARADIQALVMYLDATDDSYEYAHGRTFYAGLLSVVPRAIWPDRPENANKEKAHLMYGKGSTRFVYWIFGFPGEFLLNFGPLAMPLAYSLLAVVIMAARYTLRWRVDGDSRQLLWPLLLYLCFVTVLGDTQIFLWVLVKNGFVPCAVVAVSSIRVHRDDPSFLALTAEGRAASTVRP